MAIDRDSAGAKLKGFTQSSEAAADTETIFDTYQLASFTLADGRKVGFPVHRIQQQGASRVIERERPFRPGAKLDNTGRKAVRWRMDCVFHNSIQEPGLQEFNAQQPLYPNSLNLLIQIFDASETGDLIVPTIGRVRAQAADYSRTEDINLGDGAAVTLMFIEDNEDNVDARSIKTPTINAQGTRLADKTTFDANSAGIGGVLAVRNAAIQLQQLVNGPGVAADDILRQANAVRDSVDAVNGANKKVGTEGRDLLLDPTSTDAARVMAELRDSALRSSNEARRGRPRLITVITRRDTSLLHVATAFNQRYSDLLDVNPGIANALFLPSGTLVKVFDDATIT